jgi:hypothetical protein
MNEKNVSKLMLLALILCTIFLTIFNIILLNIILKCFGLNGISGKWTMIYTIFTISYPIAYILVQPLDNIIIKMYVKSNEKYENDFNYEYFRDIIKGYSIGTLIKCYGEKVNYKDQLVATLLKLIINEKVQITNNEIEVIDQTGLNESEKWFIKACEGYKVYSKKNIKVQLDQDNTNDALQTDLFIKEKNELSIWKEKCTKFGFLLFIINFGTLFLGENFYKDAPYLVIISFISYFLILFTLIFGMKFNNVLVRTEKGKEIQYQLIGLKNFLTDFSSINNKKIEEIKLWDEYIIYAIIFNLKGKLDIEAFKIYKKYINSKFFA